jgi:transaldolase/transaldolase/glucose-6-phosphate isomerase
MPEPTLIAVRDGADFNPNTITPFYDHADSVIAALPQFEVDISQVAQRLEYEGIEKFIKPWLELITAVEKVAQ